MAHYTSALSFLLVLVLFSFVNIEARESKFFTKAVVIHANNTTKNITHHVDPPSPSPSPLSSPSPAPVEAQINSGYGHVDPPSPSPSPLSSPSPAPVEAQINSGYGLYGRDEIPSTSGITGDSLFGNTIPTKEFNEKFGKDEFDNNDLPSNYNEHSYVTVPQGNNKDKFDDKEFSNYGLPSNYNERSYVTVPQGDNKDKFDNEEFINNGLPSNYKERSYVTVPQGTNSYDTKFTTVTNYEKEFANNEEKLTPEEEKLFDENRNEHKENSYVNVNEPQKLSETPKFAEMDNYFNDNHNTYNSDSYNVKEPQGISDTRTLENGKYHYALNGDGRQSLPRYNSEGYYGNNGTPKSKYEFDTMEEFERQEGYSQVPGEYVNP